MLSMAESSLEVKSEEIRWRMKSVSGWESDIPMKTSSSGSSVSIEWGLAESRSWREVNWAWA